MQVGDDRMLQDFASGKDYIFVRWHTGLGEELALRAAMTFAFWVRMYLGLRFLQDIGAFVDVASGLDGVEVWRPAFGSVREAYSLRRFWGYVNLCTAAILCPTQRVAANNMLLL